MAGNFLEQNRLMYVVGEEATNLDPSLYEGWDSENKRFIVGNRSRTLLEYSAYVSSEMRDVKKSRIEFAGIEKYGLYYLLNLFQQRFGQAVWVDLGCGNAIAQRQANELFEKHGKRNGIRTIGYDALPFDIKDYQYRKENSAKRIVFSFFNKYSELDLEKQYEPEILFEDITHAKFDQAPHILTCFQVLQWVTNPLEIFINVASQLKVGSVFCLTGLDKLMIKTDYGFYHFFQHLGRVPGFDNVYPTDKVENIASDPVVLVRNSESLQDFMSGYTHLFSSHDLYNGEIERSYTNYYKAV